MYVCPQCNSLVDQPKTRWWSRWRYCANGHVLYVRGFGPTLEQPFRESFLKAFAPSMIIFGIIAMTLATQPSYPKELLERHATTQMPAAVGFLFAAYCLIAGLNMLRKARVWSRQAGPVHKLVAHARGRAWGFLAAIPCLLGIAMALLLVK